eukprot:9478457-Pyramimonas_sp.AAC.1
MLDPDSDHVPLVEEAVAMVLMNLSTVGGIRSQWEIGLLVELLASSNPTTVAAAAAALWSASREDANKRSIG